MAVPIRIKDVSYPLGEGRWRWSVWLEGPPKDLNKIKFARYTLHPTFRNPVRIVRNRATGFRLDSSGWGSFTIGVETVFKDGTSQNRSHKLLLQSERRRDSSSRKPVIFLSYSAVDSQTAEALRNALQDHVATLAEKSAWLPWKRSIERSIRSADAAIGIVSDSTSPWVERELQMAAAHDLPVLRVVTGNLAEETEPRHRDALPNVRSADDAPRIAREVISWLAGQAIVLKVKRRRRGSSRSKESPGGQL